MIFKYILFIFVYILNVSLREVFCNNEKPCQKLNVVLFFAKSSCKEQTYVSCIKVLEMHEVAKVKHSFPVHQNYEAPGEVLPRPGPSCKELLKESLTSLVHYCQNALGMKTAIASVSNSQITDDIANSEPEIPPQIQEEPISEVQNVPHESPKEVVQEEERKKMDVDRLVQLQRQPAIHRPEFVNLRDIITSPEHTEVFKIRVKRELEGEKSQEPGEIVDVPLEKEGKKHPWDVLDIMSHVRFSFFGKLFEDASKNKLRDEENKIATELSQKKQDPGLFETVKTILSTLQGSPNQQLFMTIFGGHLSEISDVNSPLIQSIKHVIESTDPKNTIVVLTGACPEHHRVHEPVHEHKYAHGHEHGHEVEVEPEHGYEHKPGHEHEVEHEVAHEPEVLPEPGHEIVHGPEDEHGHEPEHDHHRKRRHEHEQNVVHIDEDVKKDQHGLLPVFARGPGSSRLSQCSLLFDVPVVVKTILEEMAPTFEGQPRQKRSIFGDIRMNKKNYENGADRVNQYMSVIINLCVFILFII